MSSRRMEDASFATYIVRLKYWFDDHNLAVGELDFIEMYVVCVGVGDSIISKKNVRHHKMSVKRFANFHVDGC